MQNRYYGAVAQSSLLGSGMPQTFKPIFSIEKHGKRPANTAFILSRYSSNSLRGDDPSAAFLQQAQTALANSEICQDSSMPCELSPFRSDPCPPLRHSGYDSDGFPCLAGQVNPSWSPQPASIAQRLSLSKVVRKCFSRKSINLVLHEFAATFGNETQYLQGFSHKKYHFHALLRFILWCQAVFSGNSILAIPTEEKGRGENY